MPALLRTIGLRAMLAAGAVLAPLSAGAQAVDHQALQDMMGEPVTTSATGSPQRASELPASAIIITQQDIARSPARDVPGLLKTYAGIDVNRWTAGQSDVAVRGGVQTYNARLLVLVDGRQVYLDHYGMTNWNLLGVQLEEIQQIELVRGPASALFGFNATSGVVNIITRRGTQLPSATVTGELGNRDIGKIAGSLMLPLTPAIGIKVAGGHAREDERRIPAQLLPPDMTRDVVSDHISGDVTASFEGMEAVLGGDHSANRQLEYLPSQLLFNQHFRNDNLHASVARDTRWGGVTLNGYINWLNADYDGGSFSDAAVRYNLRNRIIVGQASTLIRLDSANVLRLGGEYRNNQLRSVAQFAERLSYDVASANAMLDLHPRDRISVTLAGRLDRLWLRQSGPIVQPAFDDPADFDRAFTRFSFNAALLIRTSAQGQLRINGGRSHQLPSLIHLGTRLPVIVPSPIPVFLAGSPRTPPVEMWSGEIGYHHVLGATQLEATAFATRTNGAIASPGDGMRPDLAFTPAPVLLSRFRPVGDYATYGTELSAAGTVGALGWRANYTWTHTDETFSPGFPIEFALSPEATTPVHKANVALTYDVGRLVLSGVARYTSATRQFSSSTGPQILLLRVNDAVAIDARAGFRITPALEIFAAGENLTQADGAAVSPIPADRRVRAGVRLAI